MFTEIQTIGAYSDTNNSRKRQRPPIPLPKRAQSSSPAATARSSTATRKSTRPPTNRRCTSLSPPNIKPRIPGLPLECASAPNAIETQLFPKVPGNHIHTQLSSAAVINDPDKEAQLPQCMVIKITRSMATKKREFIKLRKNLIQLQNNVLEQYATLKEMESRTGTPADDIMGEVRVLSVTTWPAHDLLLLIRDDIAMSLDSEISGVFGPQILQQLYGQLKPIPEEMLAVGAEIMARRIDMLNFLRGKYRTDRASHLSAVEWKAKNAEFDQDTEKLHRMVVGTAENLKAKINFSMELAKIPWLDREAIVKKMDRVQKENLILQHKLEEQAKKESAVDLKILKDTSQSAADYSVNNEALLDELAKERAAREALKDVVSAAESMLRVARARITTLERQLKESKAELETARRKHRDLEQLYRHRESSYDARSRKLLEVSKTGEITIETLSRQRDVLEIRVKELREQAELAEKNAEIRDAEQRSRAESLQAKVAEQEKRKEAAEARIKELEGRIKDMEEVLHTLRERSSRLVDMERRRCLEYVPSKENEPSDRETEIWKELQVTRLALSRAEEELRMSRADKDSFLNSLSKIAQDGADDLQEKIATELLDREQKIVKLQHTIEEQKENEKLMEQSMTQYENQLAALRLEVKRLRNYDCYAKEISYQDLQTELLELHMQVETLTRERTALVTAAASRALMLERHERAAGLFARVTRARRDLAAIVEGRLEPPPLHELPHSEVSRSLSSVCATAADTWTALRAERARVLRLESAVLAQSLQLEREGRVRTQLERRRAILEREVLRAQASSSLDQSGSVMIKNPSLVLLMFFTTVFSYILLYAILLKLHNVKTYSPRLYL